MEIDDDDHIQEAFIGVQTAVEECKRRNNPLMASSAQGGLSLSPPSVLTVDPMGGVGTKVEYIQCSPIDSPIHISPILVSVAQLFSPRR